MQNHPNAGIIGVGMAVPENILTNADIERIVDTSDEWIVSRTGIRERRISSADETPATLGSRAARAALEDAGISAVELDLVLCATTTGDHPWPSTACLIQHEIGATRASAFDISAACSGFVYALAITSGLIQSGQMRNVLVIGSETLTKQVNWSDRNTCVLFGDGAGAAILAPCEQDHGVLASSLGSDGSKFTAIHIPAGGAREPLTAEGLLQHRNMISMQGAEVFKFAVKIMGDVTEEVLNKVGMTTKQIDLFIPHQANRRIITAAADRMKLPPEKVLINVDRYGNTSAASIPIALAEAVKSGRIRRGDILVTVGFGAGLTWGANVIRW